MSSSRTHAALAVVHHPMSGHYYLAPIYGFDRPDVPSYVKPHEIRDVSDDIAFLARQWQSKVSTKAIIGHRSSPIGSRRQVRTFGPFGDRYGAVWGNVLLEVTASVAPLIDEIASGRVQATHLRPHSLPSDPWLLASPLPTLALATPKWC